MVGIYYEMFVIIGFFIMLLILKSFLPRSLQKSFCVICGAVSLTWILLLILFKNGLFANNLIIALLIGQSTVGIYYYVERKLPEKFHLFRLPFLLTLIVTGYSLITISSTLIFEILSLFSLWIVFIILYVSRNTSSLKKLVEKIIKCCRKW